MFWHTFSIICLVLINAALIKLKNNPYFNIQIARYFFNYNYTNGLGIQNQKIHWLPSIAFIGFEFKLFLNIIHESQNLYLIDSSIDTILGILIIVLFIIQVIFFIILQESEFEISNFRGYELDDKSNSNEKEHEFVAYLNQRASKNQIIHFRESVQSTIEELHSIKEFLVTKYAGIEIRIEKEYILKLKLRDASYFSQTELKLPISLNIDANPNYKSLSNALRLRCFVILNIHDNKKFDFYIQIGDQRIDVKNFKFLFDQIISDYWPEFANELNKRKNL